MSVDIECPRCRQKFTESALVLVPGRILTCPHCGFQTAVTEHDLETARESRERLRREGS